MSDAVRVGVIGCGDISGVYLDNLLTLPEVELLACADRDAGRARQRAAEHGITPLDVAALLADDAIELIVNLTTPDAHADVALQALSAGKHVYNEKPLTIELADADRLLAEAAARGLRIGAAPDTFLGAGVQTLRQLVADGALGEMVAGDVFMLCRGHEHWHPDPAFYYRRGGGPLFDMGPYYLTALIEVLGPVRRVTGSARRSFATRTTPGGAILDVDVPTHVAAVLDFASGPVVSLTMSFDVPASRLGHGELHGSEASVTFPDPNTFAGPVQICRRGSSEWTEVPLVDAPTENRRGLGVADLAAALRERRPHRASAAVARHVLEILHAIQAASETGTHRSLSPPGA